MPASRDSSLLFSLKELEGLEQDRVARERASRDAAKEAERRAFADAERIARETEARKLETDERRRRAEEAVRREETARFTALERAEVERARAEVEARARHEAKAAEAQHEENLARIRGDASKRFHRFFAVACGLATVASLGVVAAVSVELHRSAALEQARERVAMQERDRYETMLRALDASRKDVADLERRLRAAERAGDEPRPLPAAPQKPSPSKRSPPPHGASPRPCGADGDPLDGCLR